MISSDLTLASAIPMTAANIERPGENKNQMAGVCIYAVRVNSKHHFSGVVDLDGQHG